SGGFTGSVTIRNTTAKALPKWRLAFQIPNAAVVSVVGAAVRTDGKNGTVVLLGSNVALPPGRFTTVRFKATGATGQPTACKINKLTCA
ncbi:MAG: cellulose binding domain-containing protein, partial [Streptosporangiaceae bacterium]